MTLESLIERIETRFPVGHGTNCSRAVTGEPYVVIGSQHPAEGPPAIPGTIDEGKWIRAENDEAAAVAQAIRCFDIYAANKSGKIYYRHPPTVEYNEDKTRCRVYLRCLVSDEQELNFPCERCNCGLAGR